MMTHDDELNDEFRRLELECKADWRHSCGGAHDDLSDKENEDNIVVESVPLQESLPSMCH